MSARELYERRDRLNYQLAEWHDWRSQKRVDGRMMDRMEAYAYQAQLNKEIEEALNIYFKKLRNGRIEILGQETLQIDVDRGLFCNPICRIETLSFVPHRRIFQANYSNKRES